MEVSAVGNLVAEVEIKHQIAVILKGGNSMHKLGHKKKFNGKYYTAMAYKTRKNDANRDARLLRKAGQLVRVVKEGNEYYLYVR